MAAHGGVKGGFAALSAGVAVLAAASPALADSAPELRSARFAKPAVVDRVATLRMRASDRERAVAGAVVAFAEEGAYGTSACRLASAPRRRGTRAGDTVTLTVPHRFETAGERGMLVRLDSSGCTGGGGVLLQPFTVTPVEAGEQPQQPVPSGSPIAILGNATGTTGGATGTGTGSGVALPPGVTDPVESLPGVGALPALPGVTEPVAPTDPLPVPLPDAGDVLPEPQLPLPRATVAQAGCRDADLVPTVANLRRVRRATLCLINRERRARGLRRVRLNRRMTSAAAAHSFDMVARAYFAHDAPDGQSLVDRLTRSRWLPRPSNWSAGENIAFGETPLSTARATMEGWMQSTGHRENNLDPTWRLVGVGIVPAVPGAPISGATYTAVFGR